MLYVGKVFLVHSQYCAEIIAARTTNNIYMLYSGRADYGNTGPLAEVPRLGSTSVTDSQPSTSTADSKVPSLSTEDLTSADSQPSTSTADSQPSTSTAGSQPSTSTADSEVPDTPPTTLNVDDFFVMKPCSECKLIARNNNTNNSNTIICNCSIK